ncbi:hypothetical protein [Actinomadura sp. B10D3]|uniref:hypothetical protein n=1 Tax=Actinomadura sp. B10D3 TaxID=3153557 RepID=UPI00325F7517
MTNPYFDELAERLRERGLPGDEVSRTIDDLSAYVAESGSDPVQEFGTPGEFASRVAAAEDGPVPPDTAETWTWRADAFHERDVLDRYGDEGWEVERVDKAGRFVSRRDPENPQRWEYHRETVLPGRGQAAIDRLAPDGWEHCGTWVCFEYFKRPRAATLGPEAELHSVPRTPTGRMFWSRRFYAFLGCYAAFIVAVCAAWIAFAPDDSRTTFVTGFVLGAAIVVALLAVRARHDRSQRTR